jgi:hypothetical protein
MNNEDTELLFPPRAIPALRNLRGPAWQSLVDGTTAAQDASTEHLAFLLMMVRLSGCANCNSSSYRAQHGCTQCATQTVRRYRGSDEDLQKLFEATEDEIRQYAENQLQTEW